MWAGFARRARYRSVRCTQAFRKSSDRPRPWRARRLRPCARHDCTRSAGSRRSTRSSEPDGADVLAVTCSSLNPVDISTGNGRFYGGVPETPYVIGSEAVGRTSDGRRLWYYAKETMAERVRLAQPDRAVEIPDGVDDRSRSRAGRPASRAGSRSPGARASRRRHGARARGERHARRDGDAGREAARRRRVIGAARRVDTIPDAADEVVALDGDYELPRGDGRHRRAVGRAGGEGARRCRARRPLRPARPVRRGRPRRSSRPGCAARSANILGHSLHSVPADVARRGLPRALRARPRRPRSASTSRRTRSTRIAEAWERQASGSPGVKIVVDVSG